MLCGQLDSHLRQIEQRLGIHISARGNQLQLSGATVNISAGSKFLIHLYAEICQGVPLTPESLHVQLQHAGLDHLAENPDEGTVEAIQVIRTKRGTIKPRGKNQQAYVRMISLH